MRNPNYLYTPLKSARIGDNRIARIGLATPYNDLKPPKEYIQWKGLYDNTWQTVSAKWDIRSMSELLAVPKPRLRQSPYIKTVTEDAHTVLCPTAGKHFQVRKVTRVWVKTPNSRFIAQITPPRVRFGTIGYTVGEDLLSYKDATKVIGNYLHA